VTPSTEQPTRVEVLVTEGCHLCEDACNVVDLVCADLDIAWAATDLMTADRDTIKKWREYVPVVLIDGNVHDIFRVTEARLRDALSG
jgi:glutaredoxin